MFINVYDVHELRPARLQLIIGEADDPTTPIEIRFTGMVVSGALRAGSESCRLQSTIQMTLHGNDPSGGLDRPALRLAPSFKGIYVTGTLELHGHLYHRTWTRLAAPIHQGDTSILLQHPVNWEPGQEILLVSTAMKDSRDW